MYSYEYNLACTFFGIFSITCSLFLQQDNKLQKIEIDQVCCDRFKILAYDFTPFVKWPLIAYKETDQIINGPLDAETLGWFELTPMGQKVLNKNQNIWMLRLKEKLRKSKTKGV